MLRRPIITDLATFSTSPAVSSSFLTPSPRPALCHWASLTCATPDFVSFVPMDVQARHLVNHLVSSGVCWGRLHNEAAVKSFFAIHRSNEERFYNEILSELRWKGKFFFFFSCCTFLPFPVSSPSSSIPSFTFHPPPFSIVHLSSFTFHHSSSIVHLHHSPSILHQFRTCRTASIESS
ncbi:hypothetical protein C8A00DRAFT_13599 [Chaetomidium leptoderma]|uniref:Uncharacterized protein n=1 Tax=Chaetomidium leptoderma TaxID=669021 RepID=A0AAN6ZX98_9PEZI|nr:hypothetical protein C8A00DRAFT_13599 [Chaetomidium leptoderma]